MDEILNGKYRKLKKDSIGEVGGQAKVFLCEQINDGKRYSIFFSESNSHLQVYIYMTKRIAVKLSQNRYADSELEKMKNLDNQFVVQLLDSFTVEIAYFGSLNAIVMDFYEVRLYICT